MLLLQQPGGLTTSLCHWPVRLSLAREPLRWTLRDTRSLPHDPNRARTPETPHAFFLATASTLTTLRASTCTQIACGSACLPTPALSMLRA
ncbi:hypothetical protein GQ607_011276 [Colletotrichum asianum]|uniref:Uncharacterized protein n=1 Tax=Colletotrichum asianum TaxID=702518 RepID=A0A8H3W953_9PEZI|nr:hypothetical protein GQ607_011276 [Colletotrichum asianum]